MQLLLFGVLPVLGLAYCIFKTQTDWQRDGFGLKVLWGIAASLSAVVSIALLFAGQVLSDLS